MKKLFFLALLLGGCDTIIMQYPEEETDSYETSSDASDSWDGDTGSIDTVTTDSTSTSDTSSNTSDSQSASLETQTSTDTAETSTEKETATQTVDTDTTDGCVPGDFLCTVDDHLGTRLYQCNDWARWVLNKLCAYCDNQGGCYACLDGEEDCTRICIDRMWKNRETGGYPAVCPDGFECKYKPDSSMYCDPL